MSWLNIIDIYLLIVYENMCVTDEHEATIVGIDLLMFVTNLTLTHNVVAVMVHLCPCLNMD